jgi:hypothetical protein
MRAVDMSPFELASQLGLSAIYLDQIEGDHRQLALVGLQRFCGLFAWNIFGCRDLHYATNWRMEVAACVHLDDASDIAFLRGAVSEEEELVRAFV